MKTKAITAIMMMLFLASTVMALFPLSVRAKATKTPFAGTETFEELLDPGTYWESGKTSHLRGSIELYRDACDDDRVTGYATVVFNMNWNDNTGRGSIWGTQYTVSDVPGGFWEGTWNGKMYTDGYSIHGVIHGRGLFEGLTAKFTIENGIISGYILEK